MRSTKLFGAFLALLVAAASVFPTVGTAATKGDLAKHRAAAAAARARAAAEQKKADALLTETRSLEDQIDAIAAQIAVLEGQIGTTAERRTRLETEIESLRNNISEKQREIDTTQADYDTQTDALAGRADATYRAGDWVYIDWLLNSRSVADLLERTSMIQRIMEQDVVVSQELAATQSNLEQIQADLNRSLDEIQVKRAEVQAEEDRLRGLQADRDTRLHAERTVEMTKRTLLAETNSNVSRLKAIARAEDLASARIARDLQSGSSRGSGKYAGVLRWPTPGYPTVSSKFGMRYHPILHYMRMHTGIDIHVPYGARVVAVGDGNVLRAGNRGDGYGNVVMIDHGDGLVTMCCHMSRVSVRVGQIVTQGQRVGAVGSTGLSTGPHLHFEVRVNGNPKNPMDWY